MPIKGQSPKQVVRTEMHKFKHKQLHSGSSKGPLVRNRKQAIAIALSESRKARSRGGSIEGDGKDDVTYGGTLPKPLQPATTRVPDSWMRRPSYADGGDVTADDMISAANQALASQKDRLPEPSTNGLTGWERYKQTGKVDYTPEEIEQGVNIGLGAGPGIMVGPYGAHMLRGATHPIYGEELKSAASRLRPEFQDIYKKWQGEARDAQARGTLEMRAPEGSNNPYDTDVWRNAGWSRGAEGMPRKEIPDIGAKLVPAENGYGYRLEHPAGDLHQIYDIPPIQVNPNLGARAQFDNTSGVITLKNPNDVSAALHEIQHVIQKKEGFSGGSNPRIASSMAPNELFINDRGRAEIPSWQRDLAEKQIDAGVDPAGIGAAKQRAVFKAYERSMGEAEARNVQARRSKSYRYQSHPADTEDVTRGLQYESRRHAPRARNDIEIYDTSAEANEGNIAKIKQGLLGDATRTHYLPKKYARGGSMGFNPERAASIGLARQGMIHSSIPGRTDKINMSVPTGSYIVPADITSALGQGNSMAGSSVLDRMFNKGPYGMNLSRAKGPRTHARAASLSKIKFAEGGDVPHAPIVAAGGEYVVTPDALAHLGNGDIDLAHNIMDAFVKHVREQNIKTLQGLKPPKGSKDAKGR